MIGNFSKFGYFFGHSMKSLLVTATSTPNGLRIVYPHQKNASVEIESPLEAFISTIAACETSILRAYSRRKGFKLGNIVWTRIESTYDLSHFMSEGGPDNLIGDVYMEGEIETNLQQEDFIKIKESVEKMCPVYQMVSRAGIKIHSDWKIKHLDTLDKA
jgi:uncharacterized OsmC-like protein